MPSRRFMPLLVALLACCSTPSTSTFRSPTARNPGTMFAPLDLPSPNAIRNGAGAPGPDYWQQRSDYDIQASFDAETRTVTGTAKVRYTNNSPDSLDYLWLHLEQNVFRKDSLGSQLGRRGAIAMNRSEGSGVTVTRVSDSDGQPLPLTVYDTLGRLDLPTPLGAQGAVLAFEIDWSFVLPEKVFRRFGMEKVEQGTIYQVAQWFPAMAVYDDTHGWNTLPYLGTGEFYTDFGDYELSLTLPRSMVAVATGALANPEDVYTAAQQQRLATARTSDETIVVITADEIGTDDYRPAGEGPLTWRFSSKNVRTLAWACSDAFLLDASGTEDTLIQSVYPKEALPLWSESTAMLRAAILGYNERWATYPWPVATNVNGIEGGMEYPMLIFCSERHDESGLWGVTTHEIGHNWFPMMVATDERRHAWMDEGFNSFINYYSRADWFPGEVNEGTHPSRIAGQMNRSPQMPVDTPPDQLPGRLFGFTQYAKPAAGLVLLRETIMGPERFDHAFRTYIRRWAFHHPRPADFYRTMEDAAGMDLAWFWRGWFQETATWDAAIDSVDEPNGRWPADVTITSLGELVMPLDLEVELSDGTRVRRHIPVQAWYHSRSVTERFGDGQQIVSVILDPDEALPDIDRSNNRWSQ